MEKSEKLETLPQYFLGDTDPKKVDKILKIRNQDKIEEFRHNIYNLTEKQIKEVIKTKETEIKPVYKIGTLKDYQTVGVAFMTETKTNFLGDEVGLGKTVQVAGTINTYRKEKPDLKYLFLTEKTSVKEIRNKLIQFTGTYVECLPSATKKDVEEYQERLEKGEHYSVVGGHSLLKNQVFLTLAYKYGFDYIIIDESSNLFKNTKNIAYQNAKQLFNLIPKRTLLSATPLELGAVEFFTQLKLMDNSFLPSLSNCIKDFCVQKPGAFGIMQVVGYKNEEVFRNKIALKYLARTRVELGASYENNTPKIVVVPMSKEQKHLIRKTSLYQMVYDCPSEVDTKIEFNEETTPKVKYLLDEINKLDKEQVLVYCRYINVGYKIKDYLNSKGIKTDLINGTVSDIEERNKILENFKKGEFQVLLTSVQRGLDIGYVNHTILYSIDSNPQKMVQFEGRMTREFDIENKNLTMLVCKGKEEKYIEEILKERLKASEEFTDQRGESMVKTLIKNIE